MCWVDLRVVINITGALELAGFGLRIELPKRDREGPKSAKY